MVGKPFPYRIMEGLPVIQFRLSVGLISPLFLIAAAAASGAGNDPCKVLTAEKFSQIMGYKATLDKTAPTRRLVSIKARRIRVDNSRSSPRRRQDRKRLKAKRGSEQYQSTNSSMA
jgi:hypothetical protein